MMNVGAGLCARPIRKTYNTVVVHLEDGLNFYLKRNLF